MKILVGKATVEISSEGPDVSLGTELVAYCTHLLHLKPQQRILKRCESVNDEDNIGGDSTPELLRVNHLICSRARAMGWPWNRSWRCETQLLIESGL